MDESLQNSEAVRAFSVFTRRIMQEGNVENMALCNLAAQLCAVVENAEDHRNPAYFTEMVEPGPLPYPFLFV